MANSADTDQLASSDTDLDLHCLQNRVYTGSAGQELKLPWSYWTRIYPAFANSVDPDQLASEEASWSGSALFAIIKYVNLYQQPVSSNLIGWKLEAGVVS